MMNYPITQLYSKKLGFHIRILFVHKELNKTVSHRLHKTKHIIIAELRRKGSYKCIRKFKGKPHLSECKLNINPII